MISHSTSSVMTSESDATLQDEGTSRATTTTMTSNKQSGVLPTEFIDAHHHFVNTINDGNGNDFQSFLKGFISEERYLPEHYHQDVVESLHAAGVTLIGSVHVECMPDDGPKEVAWVESLCRSNNKIDDDDDDNHDTTKTTTATVKAIVGSCHLASPTVEDDLQQLILASSSSLHLLRGVRWILDCVGPFGSGTTATHPGTLRHDGIDYLRGNGGNDETNKNKNDGDTMPEFERGYAFLEPYQLSFDLQCAPVQLRAAAKLCAKYPNIPVCIDHLGKPRMLLGPDNRNNDNHDDSEWNENELAVWRDGMKAMAELSHVHVKISMLGYAIPGWIRTPKRIALMKQLVREVVELFGPQRCMVALNWWRDGACSDADGLSSVGPSPVEFLQHISDFCQDYSEEDRHWLFVGTAKKFYRI